MIRSYRGMHPAIAPGCFIEASAQIIGDVTIGEHSSVWFNTVVRGDVNKIVIGHHTNIQDLCMVHVTRDRHETHVGNYVTVGHGVIIHGCVIEDRCLIGMGARIMDGVVVGAESIVAAGAVITQGVKIPPRSLVTGLPAKVKRPLTDEEVAFIDKHWRNYIEYKETYLNEVPHR
jgi:gamma-carbonic anhydrase